MIELVPSLLALVVPAIWLVHVAGRQNVDPQVLNDAAGRLLLSGDDRRARQLATVAPHAPYCAILGALLDEPDAERHPAIVDAILREAEAHQAGVRPYVAVSAIFLVGPVLVLGWERSPWLLGAGVAAVVGSLLWSAVFRAQAQVLDRARAGAKVLSALLAEVG